MLQVYTDGLAEPNPGVGTYGYVVYRNGKKIAEQLGFAGNPVTNNYSEYQGLVKALQELHHFADEEIMIHSDSRLLISQMGGEWRVSKKALKTRDPGSYVEKYLEAQELAKSFTRLRFVWIPREENTEADALSRVAYREQIVKRRHA